MNENIRLHSRLSGFKTLGSREAYAIQVTMNDIVGMNCEGRVIAPGQGVPSLTHTILKAGGDIS
jgi:hypothetical protein